MSGRPALVQAAAYAEWAGSPGWYHGPTEDLEALCFRALRVGNGSCLVPHITSYHLIAVLDSPQRWRDDLCKCEKCKKHEVSCR
ncbi:unnamed protein product, partial [Iphiclides podalirius]